MTWSSKKRNERTLIKIDNWQERKIRSRKIVVAEYGYTMVSKMRANNHSNCIASLLISTVHTMYLIFFHILLSPSTKHIFLRPCQHTLGQPLISELILKIIQIFICLSILSRSTFQLIIYILTCFYLLFSFREKKNSMPVSFSHFLLSSSKYHICSVHVA